MHDAFRQARRSFPAVWRSPHRRFGDLCFQRPRHLRRRFRRAKAGIVPSVNLLGFTAAEAAYRGGWYWHAAMLDYLRANRDRVLAAVKAMPGLTSGPIEATYLAWIDARSTGIDKPTAFFEAAGVWLADVAEFGSPGFGRRNFGCSRALLDTALERMAAALETLDDRSRHIIESRWLSDDKLTLHELADEYGISAERVRQVEANAIKKLRNAMAV